MSTSKQTGLGQLGQAKRGMGLCAECNESHNGQAGLAKAAPAPCMLHQNICVWSAEIDDLFYAFLGISR